MKPCLVVFNYCCPEVTGYVFLVDEDPDVPHDDLVHVGMQSWTEAIDSCLTFSRLHLLLCMFDSCVKWEKSAENAVSYNNNNKTLFQATGHR